MKHFETLLDCQSDSHRMLYSLYKCGQIVTKIGKVLRTVGVKLPNGSMADMKGWYKYLGIPQTNVNLEEVARKSAMAKYPKRVRQVLHQCFDSHQLHH